MKKKHKITYNNMKNMVYSITNTQTKVIVAYIIPSVPIKQ